MGRLSGIDLAELAQGLKPYIARWNLAASGGDGGQAGGGLATHALSGPWHTGQLAQAQAPWAVTDAELAAHASDPDAHHARQHDILSTADHTVTGSTRQIVGLTSTNTLGLLTPSSAPTDARILASDSAGGLTLQELRVGAAVTLYSAGNAGLGPDVQLAGTGLIAAENSLYINIDSTNTVGNAALIIQHDAATSGATELARITEDGHFNLGAAMSLAGTNEVNTEPDIKFFTNGLVAAENSIYLVIDGDGSGTDAVFSIRHDGLTASGATEVARFTEAGWLRLGAAGGPAYELDVTGEARATVALRTATTYSTTKVQTPLIDTAAGVDMTIAPNGDLYLSPTGLDIVVDDAAALRSDNFLKTILTAGFRIGPTAVAGQTGINAGSAEFDELRARFFVADETRVDRGQWFLTKSYGILSRSFTAPASVGGTAFLYVENSPHIAGAVFSTNDWLLLRYLDMSSGITLTSVWGQVSAYTTTGLTDEQRWTFTLRSGTGGLAFVKGAVGIDFGGPTSGYFILADAVTATSPYMQVAKWTTNPYSPANYTVLTQMGRLDGVGFTGEYGLAAGVAGFGLDDAWIAVSTAGAQLNKVPLRMYSGSGVGRVQTVNIDAAGTNIWVGNGSSDKRLSWDGTTFEIVGKVSANSGEIANWDILTNTLSSSNIRLISGAIGTSRLEVGDGTTAGTGAGIVSRSGANSYVLWAGDLYADIDANTPFRVTLGGNLYASNADITGAIKATSGYIGGASSGWAISSNEISSTNIHMVAGGIGAARVELGNYAITDTENPLYGTVGGMLAASDATNTFFWAGKVLAQRTSAPFRVTLGGTLRASDAYITGEIKATSGYIGGTTDGWAIAANQITSTGIGLYAGAANTARLQVGTGSNMAGVVSPASGAAAAIWAGASYANRDSAPFVVQADGTFYADAAILDGAAISNAAISNANVSSLYAGNSAVRLATDGQRFLLPNTTGIDVPTSSSALRWFPTIDGTHDATKNYTGLVGYRHTTYNTVDMLYTAYVGSTDYATYAARFILQAGHSDGTTYTDTRLEIVREAGSGARYIGVYGDRMEVNGSMRLMTLSANPGVGGIGESAHIYCKGDKFIIAYNDAGTIRYKYLTLNSTGVTWQQTVTAP